MSTTQEEIKKLMHIADGLRDASSLYDIANRLRVLGSWDNARKVEKMAKDVERRYAEQAAR